MDKASVSAFTQYNIKKRTQKKKPFPCLISTFEYIVYFFYFGDYHKLSTCSNTQSTILIHAGKQQHVKVYSFLQQIQVYIIITHFVKVRQY